MEKEIKGISRRHFLKMAGISALGISALGEMQLIGNTLRATIPADYTDSMYPLQYYFELFEEPGKALLHTDFSEDFNNQPYFVIRKTS